MSWYDDSLQRGLGRTNLVRSINHIKLPVKNPDRIIWQGCSESCIPFSMEMARSLKIWIGSSLASTHPEIQIAPPDIITYFGNEAKRFLCALIGYMRAPRQLLSLQYLLEGILDPLFAEKLKKHRVAFWSRKWSSNPNEDDGLDIYVPEGFQSGTDIGDVFNYKYWIRWSEPDPADWKWGLLPCPEVSSQLYKEWQEALLDLLPSFIPETDPLEILLSVSSSSSRKPSGARSKVFLDKTTGKLNRFSHGPLKGYRHLVYKGPTEVRDCVTLSVEQSNTIKWIDSQITSLCARIPFSAYGLTDQQFDHRLTEFFTEDSWFYNRDLTKEGLTKPRWLIKAAAEVLQKKYPHIQAFKYMDIYDSFTLILENGDKVYTNRGHGLGMANALTTLIQCASFNLLKMKDVLDEDADALFYNDDASIKTSTELGVITLAEEDTDLLLQLGLLPKEKKTYASKLGILCERYFPKDFSRKQSFVEYIRRLPFAASCILEAKELYNLIEDPNLGPPDPNLVDLLISFWGYEYTYNEAKLPWFAGGWLRPKYNSVDLSFLNEFEFSQDFSRGLEVGPPNLRPKKFAGKERWVHPILQFFEYKGVLPEEVERSFDLNKTIGEMRAKFSRGFNRKKRENFLLEEISRRLILWSTPAKPVDDLVSVYIKVINKYPDIDFIPPDSARIEMNPELCADSIGHPVERPNQPNKILGAICLWSQSKYKHGVIPWPHWPGEPSLSFGSDRLDKFAESILSLPGVSRFLWVPEKHIVFEVSLKKRYFIDDVNVNQAWMAVSGERTIIRPTHLSPRGKLMNSISDYIFLAEKYGRSDIWDFWMAITRNIAIPYMFGIFTPEDVQDILKDFEDSELPESIKDIKEEPPPDNREYTSDYWAWVTQPNWYKPYPYLTVVFDTVRSAIQDYNIFKSLGAMSEGRHINPMISANVPPKGSPLDILCTRLVKLDAGDYQGHYVYRPPDLTFGDLADDSEDSGGAFGGLFD